MAVRRVGSDDWQKARDLRLRALVDTPEAFLSSFDEEQQLGEAEWRARVSSADDRAWLVDATDEDDFTGMVVVAFLGESRDLASLLGMWVEPRQRRKGIGKRLVEAAIEAARTADATRVELEVNETLEPAVRLYRSCGFVPTGRQRLLPAGDTAVQMVRDV
jgi:ribosomal protein S18 acetylase RimI-like enzyme